MKFNLNTHLQNEYGDESCDREYVAHRSLTELGYRKINSNQWLNHNLMVIIKANGYIVRNLADNEGCDLHLSDPYRLKSFIKK